MKRFIYKLRQKSEDERRRILYAMTIGCGVVLIFLWIYSLGTNLGNADVQEQTANTLAPFSVLKDNLTLPSW